MKSFALAAIAGVAASLDVPAFEYVNYLAKFNKNYDLESEFKMRFERFVETHEFIKKHNEQENVAYTAGHNQFSDWTYAEYKAILGYRKPEGHTRPVATFNETNSDGINWVDLGAVTPVKDQGQCGSCWAFSSTGSIEGAHFVKTGKLESFSEQQLVDCAFYQYGYPNYACYGGLQDYAYNYYETHNAELESVYPYVSGTSLHRTTCQYNESSATSVEVSTYAAVTPNNPAQMKAALEQQPLAIAIEADQYCFQTYQSGIFDNAACGTNLDHAVLLVGYGVENGTEYWLMKNSWNTTWGDQGYMKLAITGNDAGICGIQSDPEFPTTN